MILCASSSKERRNAFASHPVRSHHTSRSSFCRIERQNGPAASAYSATSRPVFPILADIVEKVFLGRRTKILKVD
jgi:hypothetical protein